MTKEEWIALAERCEKATTHHRGVDCEISRAATGQTGFTPYTASIDAITELIDWELPGARVEAIKHGSRAWVELSNFLGEKPVASEATATTEALARCAAFCRAMAEKAGTP